MDFKPTRGCRRGGVRWATLVATFKIAKLRVGAAYNTFDTFHTFFVN